MTIVYLNNQYLPLAEAKIPVLDRGFLFGDGIYEVIPVYNGKLFRVDEHLERLDTSLASIELINPHTRNEWKNIFNELVKQNNSEHPKKSIYLQVTRGSMETRFHAFPEKTTPTVFAKIKIIDPIPKEVLANGKTAITLDDNRWLNCHIKSIALLPNILLHQQAVNNGCEEAILVRNGKITEGTTSNVFIVKNETIITPPKSNLLLPGVTRDLTLELAQKNNFKFLEKEITKPEFFAANEIWISSSNREIFPIVSVDGIQVGTGKAGAIWNKMIDHFHTYIESY